MRITVIFKKKCWGVRITNPTKVSEPVSKWESINFVEAACQLSIAISSVVPEISRGKSTGFISPWNEMIWVYFKKSATNKSRKEYDNVCQ